jgi:hypothetical protein
LLPITETGEGAFPAQIRQDSGAASLSGLDRIACLHILWSFTLTGWFTGTLNQSGPDFTPGEVEKVANAVDNLAKHAMTPGMTQGMTNDQFRMTKE